MQNDAKGLRTALMAACTDNPRDRSARRGTPISPKVILVGLSMTHDSADRGGCEAASSGSDNRAPLQALRLHHRVKWRNHGTALGFIIQTREDENEDSDHRTFCRRSRRRSSGRAGPAGPTHPMMSASHQRRPCRRYTASMSPSVDRRRHDGREPRFQMAHICTWSVKRVAAAARCLSLSSGQTRSKTPRAQF
jgi:hypothetical protein